MYRVFCRKNKHAYCSFQVDDLQKEVVVLKNRVHEQRAINESRASKQEENMNGLRAHLQQLVDDADRENDQIKTVHIELTELLESVEKLFLSIHCDISPMYKILGKTHKRLAIPYKYCNNNNIYAHTFACRTSVSSVISYKIGRYQLCPIFR